MNKMKTLNYILIISALFLYTSCGSIDDKELYGNWRIYHIFYDNKEILGNDFEFEKWDVPFHRTKAFYIMKEKWLNIYLERHGKPITAQFKIFKNDSLNFEIFNSSDSKYDGRYSKIIYTDTINKEGISIVNFYLKLESEKTVILAAKSESLDSLEFF